MLEKSSTQSSCKEFLQLLQSNAVQNVLPIKISHFLSLNSGVERTLESSATADAQRDDNTSAVLQDWG